MDSHNQLRNRVERQAYGEAGEAKWPPADTATTPTKFTAGHRRGRETGRVRAATMGRAEGLDRVVSRRDGGPRCGIGWAL
ncbi:hypothetical protein Ssi02_20020 [Sinosporangium siamense]|uniref:Uncharacterized protein n=1 Tax=Sinosporangium siamense TaxID=1367973 RepID=A0A919V692_9ACTN|nr:hypothetical protein Ssi02_20020 [Sinosporangium siamense]